jgi:hypothetical protein
VSEVDRRLKGFPARFPRPDEQATRRVEQRLRERLTDRRPRPMRRSMPIVLAALALGAAVGAGVVAIGAGAATERVTLTIRPVIVPWFGQATLFGSVSNGRDDEEVVFEMRECGEGAYRVFYGARTSRGGAFSVDYNFGVGGLVRARWKDNVSEPVDLKRRASLYLRRRAGGRFEVVVWAKRFFDGKRAHIERWDRRGARWIVIRRVALKRIEQDAGGTFVGSGNTVRLRVGSGVQLRAVFPLEQARPCYVGGVSTIIRS